MWRRDLARPRIENNPKGQSLAILLEAHRDIVAIETVSVGFMTAFIVRPR
jgi:hypothetical protein